MTPAASSTSRGELGGTSALTRRIAVYAPLKPPDHPVPSGDRRMAQMLWQALERAGWTPELAARLRARDALGDPARQRRLAALGRRLADRYVRRVQQRPAAERPAAWLTYHLYYKAPDWIGPAAAHALGIPYLVAEASRAPKRAHGPWADGHAAVDAALAQAAAVLTINPADAECLPPEVPQVALPPFLDTAARAHARPRRAALARQHGLDPGPPWLVAVGMMRAGAKLASYRLLADALGRLVDRPWRLLLVGDGPARAEVARAFDPLAQRTAFVGALEPGALPGLLESADLFVWPAVEEAYGMALLEAQAVGLPAVAGAVGGVPAILRDGETGRLAAPGDPADFARQVAALLDAPAARRAMGSAAAANVARAHTLDAAAATLARLLAELTGRPGARRERVRP
jgi:glycosyltransferase involved in cell wall biosynthesis